MTNCPRTFQNSCAFETALSDFHQLVVTVMKTTYKTSEPKIIIYRGYKYLNNESFREELLQIEAIGNNCDESFRNFTFSCNAILNKHLPPPRKKVYKGKSNTFHEKVIVKDNFVKI